MPGFNRMGPAGEGPRTGRGSGKCNPDARRNTTDPENKENLPRRGRGPGNGPGLARRRGKGFQGGNS